MPRTEKAHIPTRLRWEVWVRDDFRCHYCGNRFELSLDHLVAERLGGPTTLDNLVTACMDCNRRKGIAPAGDFAANVVVERFIGSVLGWGQ